MVSAGVQTSALYPPPVGRGTGVGRGSSAEPADSYVVMLNDERRALAGEALARAQSGVGVRFANGLAPDRVRALLDGAIAVLDLSRAAAHAYATLEGFTAAKPVITVADAGVPTELVVDGINGRVVAPEPGALAAAIDQLDAEREGGVAMGHRGHARVYELGIGAEALISRLIG